MPAVVANGSVGECPTIANAALHSLQPGEAAARWLYSRAHLMAQEYARKTAHTVAEQELLCASYYADLMIQLDIPSLAREIAKAKDPRHWIEGLRLAIAVERHRRRARN